MCLDAQLAEGQGTLTTHGKAGERLTWADTMII
jgi:hypothetical protein